MKRAAFSLVEMLVAVILLSLLIGVAIFAFKYQLLAIHKAQKVGLDEVLKYNQLKSSIESMKYYVVDDYDMFNKPMKNLHYYFDADEHQMNFITTNPYFSKNTSVVNIRCEESQLIYQEEKLYGPMDFLSPSLLQTSNKTTVYKNLEACSFKYIYRDRVLTELSNDLPTLIELDTSSNSKEKSFYFSVKPDNNRTKYILYDRLYNEE